MQLEAYSMIQAACLFSSPIYLYLFLACPAGRAIRYKRGGSNVRSATGVATTAFHCYPSLLDLYVNLLSKILEHYSAFSRKDIRKPKENRGELLSLIR